MSIEAMYDQETIIALRECGLSDAMWEDEENPHRVTIQTYIDGELAEHFTMHDWWVLDTVVETVANANRRFADNQGCEVKVIGSLDSDPPETFSITLEGRYV